MIPSNRTWEGGDSDDKELLDELPADLRAVITNPNGFILHHGAIHFRGCMKQPAWHSLREAWCGDHAFHRLYKGILESDVPFAQDQVGDQYFLRGKEVFRLDAETGDVSRFEADLESFLAGIADDIAEYLNVGLDHQLQPGFLLQAYPPFCVAESGHGTSLRPVPAKELILFHADLASQISHVPDGGKIQFTLDHPMSEGQAAGESR
jgi:hypothetical protein